MKKTLLSLLVFGGLLAAAPVQVSYVNPGTPTATYGGYYVGPYTLNINGVNTPAMCLDDFLHVENGDKWSANVTNVNSADLSNTYLGSGDLGKTTRTIFGTTYSASQVYTAETYLFSQILQFNGVNTGNAKTQRGYIQEAAWAIMDANTLANNKDSNVKSYITLAFNNLNFNTSYFSIVSQTGTYSYGSKQEFLVANAPEPASLVLFGSGIFGIGLIGAIRRRRQSGGVA